MSINLAPHEFTQLVQLHLLCCRNAFSCSLGAVRAPMQYFGQEGYLIMSQASLLSMALNQVYGQTCNLTLARYSNANRVITQVPTSTSKMTRNHPFTCHGSFHELNLITVCCEFSAPHLALMQDLVS